jgi:hypothetical protein
VTVASAKVIVTRPNLVPRPGQAYDAPNAAPAGMSRERGPYAGTLSLEAQESKA